MILEFYHGGGVSFLPIIYFGGSNIGQNRNFKPLFARNLAKTDRHKGMPKQFVQVGVLSSVVQYNRSAFGVLLYWSFALP